MTYYSLTFLLLFLPIALLLYVMAPERLRNMVLLAVSLGFYVLLDAANLPLLIIILLLDYLTGIGIYKQKNRRASARLLMGIGVLKTLGMLLFYMVHARINGTAMPAGILVWSLSSIGYVVDVYRGDIPFESNIIRFMLYHCFFGRVIMGPYVSYPVIHAQLNGSRALSLPSVFTGLSLFIRGLAKRVVISDTLLAAYARMSEIPLREQTTLCAWMRLFSFVLGTFFFFASYCDCARGLGLMFSFKLPRNVLYPLYASSVREFVAHFQITWNEYLRRYVYRSLGGKRYGVLSDIYNTLFWMMLYGAWFGLTPNCILWGLIIAVFILGERYLYGKMLSRLPNALSRLITGVVIFLSFAVFSQNSLDASGQFIRLLFTIDRQMLINDQIVYILSQYYWALLLGLLLSGPLFLRLARWCKRHFPKLADAGTLTADVLLLGVSCMMLLAR